MAVAEFFSVTADRCWGVSSNANAREHWNPFTFERGARCSLLSCHMLSRARARENFMFKGVRVS